MQPALSTRLNVITYPSKKQTPKKPDLNRNPKKGFTID